MWHEIQANKKIYYGKDCMNSSPPFEFKGLYLAAAFTMVCHREVGQHERGTYGDLERSLLSTLGPERPCTPSSSLFLSLSLSLSLSALSLKHGP